MKKNASLIRISTFAVLLLLFVGCHSDDENFIPIPNPDAPITFQISIMNRGDAARAATDAIFETTWQEGDAIGLYAVRYIDGVPTPLLPGGNYIDNAKLTLNADGTWTGDAYYPLLSKSTSSDKYAFYAYYPYIPNLADPRVIPVNTLTDPTDHLTATTQDVNHGEIVPLNFTYKTAMVQLNFDDTKCYASPALSVKLRGCTPTGTLNLSTGTVTATGLPMDIPMTRFERQIYRALVPAQTIAETSMFLIDDLDHSQSMPLPTPFTLSAGQTEVFDRIIKYNDYAQFIVDDTFRAKCMNLFDADGDGRLSYPEVMNITSLSISWGHSLVQTLVGIEHFKNLSELFCDFCEFTELSLSDLPQLTRLDCSYSRRLKTLSLSNLPQLTRVACNDCQLETLSLSNLPELIFLDCLNNQLTTLSLPDLPNLAILDCRKNNLTELPYLSGLTQLEFLFCEQNPICELDVSTNTALKQFQCGNSRNENTNAGTQLTVYVAQGKELGVYAGELLVRVIHLNSSGNEEYTPIITKGIPVYGVTVLDKP